MKNILLTASAVLLLGWWWFHQPSPTPVKAAQPPATPQTFGQCVGPKLAEYMNQVCDNISGNINLLTPAFNGTSYTLEDIVSNFLPTANMDCVAGVAVNIYDLPGGEGALQKNIDRIKGLFPGQDIYITETGYNSSFDTFVKNYNASVPGDGSIKAALLFNAFGGNPQFASRSLTDPQIRQLNNNGKLGVNSARFFAQDDNYYNRAQNLGLAWNLEIADSGKAGEVVKAYNKFSGNTIIRIGVGGSSGGFDDPVVYAEFLNGVAAQVGKTVYAIAGPNEPDLEHWLAPECGGDNTAYLGQMMCQSQEPVSARYTSRPVECGQCISYVPDPVLACAGNFTYQRDLNYTSFDTRTCNGEECGVDLSMCALTIGDQYVRDVYAVNDYQLLAGPIPWKGRFNLNARSVILPFVGNDTEESRERYIADYIDGTIGYKSVIDPASKPPGLANDLFDPFADQYYELPFNDPRFVSYNSIVNKLVSQEYLDQLRYNLLDRVDPNNLSDLPVHNISIQSYAGDQATLMDFVDDPARRRPLPPAKQDRIGYILYRYQIKRWKELDDGKWARLWPYVPIATREDTPGNFQPLSQPPSVIMEVTGNNTSLPDPPPIPEETPYQPPRPAPPDQPATDMCLIGGEFDGQFDDNTGQVTVPEWTLETTAPLNPDQPDLAEFVNNYAGEKFTLSGVFYQVDPITYQNIPNQPVSEDKICLTVNICRTASSGCGGGAVYHLDVRHPDLGNGQAYRYKYIYSGRGAHITYKFTFPKGTYVQLIAQENSACFTRTEITADSLDQDMCKQAYVYANVSNNQEPQTICGSYTDQCQYDRPLSNGETASLGESGRYWAEKCGLPTKPWDCGQTPVIRPPDPACPSGQQKPVDACKF